MHEIEALVARAWPPLTILDLDGWQLRSAGGLTRRANSAWPRAAGTRLGLDDRLRQTESFYVQGGLDPAVQLSPSARPAGLAGVLRQRGYAPTEPVVVRTRRVETVAGLAAPAVDLVDREAWLGAWASSVGASEHEATMARRILERVTPPAGYAVLADGSELAVARGVADGGWLGVDLLGATPALRTPRAGAALLATLARWALRRGVEQVHVEVDPADAAAAALLTGAEFRRAYTHRYLIKPRELVSRA